MLRALESCAKDKVLDDILWLWDGFFVFAGPLVLMQLL